MAKVLLALFVGLFRKRPTPSHEPPDRPEGQPVAPAAATAAASEESGPAAVGQ
jgi:hypothetical protein